MGILSTALKADITIGGGRYPSAVPPSRSVVYHSPWFDETTTTIGKSVTAEKAMTVVPFYAGVRLIAESIGRLPLLLYRRAGEDRERATDRKLYGLLHDEWNPEMTAMVGKETLAGHVVTRGNGYAERVRDDLGRDAQLWPLRPDRMTVLRDPATGRKLFRYRIESLGDEVELTSDQVFHVPGFGYDGLVGYSIVSLFRESLALGLSAQEFGSRFFKSGAQPAAVVKHPAGWDDERVGKFSRALRAGHGGLSNAQRIAVIEEGVSWDTVGMNLDDAQFLETRKYQRGEVATMLNIPPHMLQDVERSTSWGTGIEEQTLGFVTFSLGSHLDRFAGEANRQLVRPAYGTGYYAEFLVEALLKGRALDRWQVYQLARQLGVLNGDAIAKRENLPIPADGSGAAYWRQQGVAEPTVDAEAKQSLTDVVEAIGALIRAGFEPAAVLRALNQPAIPHSGLEPITVSEQIVAAPPRLVRVKGRA